MKNCLYIIKEPALHFMALVKVIVVMILMSVVIQAGCTKNPGVKKHFWQKNNNMETLKVFCSRKANKDTPVALDLVFVYNSLLTDELLKMNADTWFKSKSGLSSKFRNDFNVISYEVVPFSETDTLNLPSKHGKAISIIMFAKYQTKAGSTPADMTMFANPIIKLNKDNYSIVEE